LSILNYEFLIKNALRLSAFARVNQF